MKLTKERKIYASVCGLAAMLFAADQLFSAKQADAAVPAEQAAVVTRVAPVTAIAATQVNVVAERLREIGKSENLSVEAIVDAFRGASASAGESTALADTFKSSHVLGAVMVSGRGAGTAIIDGKCVRIGETVDGYTLESVAKGIAVLSNGDAKVELSLEGHSAETAVAEAK